MRLIMVRIVTVVNSICYVFFLFHFKKLQIEHELEQVRGSQWAEFEMWISHRALLIGLDGEESVFSFHWRWNSKIYQFFW